jgi:hypothetical protein
MKAMWERNRYTRMTKEQRATLRKRQNTAKAHQQKKNHRKMKKDAVCPESIAMENLTWVPKMESPIIQAQCAATFEAAWNDPDFFNPTWRPLSILTKFEQSPNPVNDDANDMTQVLRHRNMTHGERQVLCAQQNQRFQDTCVNRPSAPLHEDEDVMAPKLPRHDNLYFLISFPFNSSPINLVFTRFHAYISIAWQVL